MILLLFMKLMLVMTCSICAIELQQQQPHDNYSYFKRDINMTMTTTNLSFNPPDSQNHSPTLQMRGPDFFIIGTQKGGTTSARLNIRQHPDVFMSAFEMHFFDMKSKVVLNTSAYYGQFVEAKTHQLIGDCTPSYMYLPSAIEAIYAFNTRAKLIIFLRNPITRAFSAYKMHNYDNHNIIDNGTDSSIRPFDILQSGHIKRGIYITQLHFIERLFKRSQLHIECSEAILHSLDYTPIFHFLGLSTHPINATSDRVSYVNRSMTIREVTKLAKFYQPFNNQLLDWLNNGTLKEPGRKEYYQRLMNCVDDWDTETNAYIRQLKTSSQLKTTSELKNTSELKTSSQLKTTSDLKTSSQLKT
jgi:hypothetical protein